MRTQAHKSDGLSSGKLAQQSGAAIDTIRYYERAGLLPEPQRLVSGYRVYAPDMVARLRFIRRAKHLGFTLDEIAELLALSADRERGVRGVKDKARAKLSDVERKLAELRRVQSGLKKLIAACPGHGEPGQCPILLSLSHEDKS